jgi:hypothetical protein
MIRVVSQVLFLLLLIRQHKEVVAIYIDFYWKGLRQSKEYRSRRERLGELVQFDGSHHKWFEGRGPSYCLITMIDDTTNTRLSRFCEQEAIAGAMGYFPAE